MKRKSAMGIANNVRCKHRGKLERCVKGELGGVAVILALDKAQDDLYEACLAFEAEGLADVCDDLYIACFDALSFISTARRCRPISMHLVQLAIDALDRIYTEAAAV